VIFWNSIYKNAYIYRANVLYSHLFTFEVTNYCKAFFKLYKIERTGREITFLSSVVIAIFIIGNKRIFFFIFILYECDYCSAL